MVTFHFIRQLIFSEISGIRLGNSYIYIFCAIDNLLWTFISKPATYSQHIFMWMIKHGSFSYFLWAHKLKYLFSEIIKIHFFYITHLYVQVILLKFEMADLWTKCPFNIYI